MYKMIPPICGSSLERLGFKRYHGQPDNKNTLVFPNDTEDPDLLVDRILVALGGTTCNPVEATGRRKAAPAINVLSHLL